FHCYSQSYQSLYSSFLFFFNDTPTPEIYTLSLHDALPIFTCALTLIAGHNLLDGVHAEQLGSARWLWLLLHEPGRLEPFAGANRSEEHTSELQSRSDLVCRLLLEKKKKKKHTNIYTIHQKI